MRSFPITTVVFILALSALGQNLTVVPSTELEKSRDQFARAYEKWQRASSGLERDVFKQNHDSALERIDQSEELAGEMVVARNRYYNAILQRLDDQMQVLKAPVLGVDPHDIAVTAGKKLDLILDEARKTNSHPSTGDAARDTLIGEQADTQQKALDNLKLNLQNQIAAAEHAGNAAASAENIRLELLRSYEDVHRLIGHEVEGGDTELALWTRYFESLRQIVSADQKPKKGKAEAKAPRSSN